MENVNLQLYSFGFDCPLSLLEKIKAMWCGDSACEDKIKEDTGGVKSRCIPFEEEQLSDVCVCCGKPARHMVYWGRQY